MREQLYLINCIIVINVFDIYQLKKMNNIYLIEMYKIYINCVYCFSSNLLVFCILPLFMVKFLDNPKIFVR